MACRHVCRNALVDDALAYLAIVRLLARECWRDDCFSLNLTRPVLGHACRGNITAIAPLVTRRITATSTAPMRTILRTDPRLTQCGCRGKECPTFSHRRSIPNSGVTGTSRGVIASHSEEGEEA